MRPAFLIAWREFAENAKTKGFWLGLLLFPAIITASIQVPIFLEKQGTPTRHFVLVDAGGGFAPLLREKLAGDGRRRRCATSLAMRPAKRRWPDSSTRPTSSSTWPVGAPPKARIG